MTPAFASWSDFFAMGGYALYVWLAVAMSVIHWWPGAACCVTASRNLTRCGAAAGERSAHACGASATGGGVNIRRKNRLWIACAVLAGLALTITLVLYALRSNIDLFYTPGEILYGKRETQQMPEVGQRLRVGAWSCPVA